MPTLLGRGFGDDPFGNAGFGNGLPMRNVPNRGFGRGRFGRWRFGRALPKGLVPAPKQEPPVIKIPRRTP